MSEDNNKIIKANDDYMINIVQKRIKKNEGYSGTPYTLKYKDKEEKFTTGGFGHRMANNTAASQEDVLTKEGWEQVFQDDFKKATKGAERLLNGATIPVEAFGVLTEMVFQMGEAGVAGFPTMLKHLKAGNTTEAAAEMLRGSKAGTASDWSKQTPDRAFELYGVMYDVKGEDNSKNMLEY
tara:strand:- start:253 stop:795 length:543 start_codon:yes stop_codon:yes gene_type:complete